MNIKIRQPAGIGDILFCLKIARTYISQGHTVYWPVIPQYSWIKNYIEFDGLKWEEGKDQNFQFTIDLQSAGKVFPEITTMDAKYKMAKMDYRDWRDFAVFKRNKEKEEKLYKRMITVEPYCLICDTFGSPPGVLKRFVPINPCIFNVVMGFLEDFTPFDWCKIIENASELRLVDTCFIYLAEKIDLKATEMYLYSRQGRFYTGHLWKKPWKYVI